MAIFSGAARSIGSSVMQGLRGAGSALSSYGQQLSRPRDTRGQSINYSSDYNINRPKPKLTNSVAGSLLTLAAPGLAGAVTQGTDALVNYTKSLSGTPTQAPAATTPAPVSTVTNPQSSYSSQAYSTPSSATTTPNPALAQLKAESAATQGGNNSLARSLSNSYTGRASTGSTTGTPTSTTTLGSNSAMYDLQGTRTNVPVTDTKKTQPSILDSLRNRVTSLSTPGSEEQQLQDELTSLRESAKLGITGLEGQGRGIPLSLIRGEQAKLGEQAAIQEQTLMERIAAKAAQRQAALTAAQNEFTNAQAEQERQDTLTAPVTVGNSILQYDPATQTYKTLYSSPTTAEKPPATVQEYEYAKANGYGGSFLDYQQATAQMSGSGGAFNLSPGQTRYDDMGNIIASAPSTTDTKTQQSRDAALQNAQTASTLINEILSSPGFNAAIGIPGLSNFIPGTSAQTTKAKIDQLKSLLTLSMLPQIKGTGALSDRDIAILESSAGALNTSMSEADFRAELQKIQSTLGNVSASGSTASPYDDLLNQGLISQEEYQELLQEAGFTNDPSMSQNGSAQQIAAAIRQVESGGNYNARGGSGEGGAYQFMPATWKQWAGKYLGDANAQMSQANQDKVATMRIQDWLNEGRTPAEIALLWNSGKTTPVRGVNRYGVAYDSGAYRDKVLGALRNA